MVLPKVFGRTTSSPSTTTRASSSASAADHSKPTGRTSPDPRPSSPASQRPTPSRSTSRPLSRSPEKKASAKHSKKSSLSLSPKKKDKPLDPNTHPLNLPPEQRARLSRLSARMDQEKQQTNGNGTADKPVQNGDGAPAPPPHKTPSTPPPSTEDAEAFKAAGNKYFKAGDYSKAIQEYTKAVEADPKSPTYKSNRAAAYMSAGKYIQALDDCREADELDPNNAKILLRMARIYTSLGRPKEALETFDRIDPPATQKDRQPAVTMNHHVSEAEEQIRNSTSGSMAIFALDQAEKGLGSSVTRPRKWALLRGEAYLKMGNVNALGDAQNIAMSLLRNNSADPEALVLRGRALYAQGENDKALQHFRQAISCDPDFKDAVKYLRMVQKLDRTKEEGNGYFKTGKYQQAVDTYTSALEIDPQNRGTNSKILQNRALCYTKLKEWQKAIEDCERALKLDPSYTKARKTKAKALGESGNWEEAVKELKAIAESNPEEPGIAKEVRNAELELKKSKRKDYYKILGVEKDADDGQIKKAYRKLAIIHHPDKNQGDEAAADRFKDIGEAYETLSDSEKRARYDSGEDLIDPSEQFGGGGFGGGMGGMGSQIDPEVLFQMFGGQMGGGGFGGGGMGGGGRRGGGGGFPGGFHFG
ncbi:TPR-like protein [Aureobasidium pullulans]|nr:TPR-like protein [Aureobasidium pullulans]THZ32214.1 TPR-like protein [Aureobasidium pullulans]THZ72945.1 TPR-like protein [Aureobasidium pullulans]TIA04483.1 TPR-like protein [Aureobasidium pullulans]